MSFRLSSTLILPCLLLMTGCMTIRESAPPRTAHEQILLSYAVRDSMAAWELPEVAGRTVHLDETYMASIDQAFVVGEVRDWLGRQGAILVPWEKDADIRLELRSAGVGIEKRDALIGLPSFVMPLPGSSVETPELALYKETRFKGLAALLVTGYDTTSHRRLFGAGPRIGQTYQLDARLLYIPVAKARHNVPEELAFSHPKPRHDGEAAPDEAGQPARRENEMGSAPRLRGRR